VWLIFLAFLCVLRTAKVHYLVFLTSFYPSTFMTDSTPIPYVRLAVFRRSPLFATFFISPAPRGQVSKVGFIQAVACNTPAYLALVGGAWPQGLFEMIKNPRRRRFHLSLPIKYFREPVSTEQSPSLFGCGYAAPS